MWKMSIQYMVLGFEPTTFGTWVSSHDHKTRAPAQMNKNLPNWWDKETDNVIKVWEGGRERGSMWKTREREWVRKWIRERERTWESVKGNYETWPDFLNDFYLSLFLYLVLLRVSHLLNLSTLVFRTFLSFSLFIYLFPSVLSTFILQNWDGWS